MLLPRRRRISARYCSRLASAAATSASAESKAASMPWHSHLPRSQDRTSGRREEIVTSHVQARRFGGGYHVHEEHRAHTCKNNPMSGQRGIGCARTGAPGRRIAGKRTEQLALVRLFRLAARTCVRAHQQAWVALGQALTAKPMLSMECAPGGAQRGPPPWPPPSWPRRPGHPGAPPESPPRRCE